MESTGRAQCVQLSAAAYAACALPDGIVGTRVVDVKGKGRLDTFIVPAGGEVEAAVRRALAAAPVVAAAAPASPAVGAGGRKVSAKARWRRLSLAVRTSRAFAAGASGAGGTAAQAALAAAAAAADADAAPADADDDNGDHCGISDDDADTPRALLPGDAGAGAMLTWQAKSSGGAPASSSSRSLSAAGGGGSGSAGFRDASAADALRQLGLSHLGAALASLWAPPLLFHAANARHAARFTADGVSGAAAMMALYRPAYACVLFACVLGGAAFFGRARLPRRLAAALAPRWGAGLVWAHSALMLFTSLTHTLETVLLPSDGGCGAPWDRGTAGMVPAPHPAACARSHFWLVHAAFVPILWLQAQLPLRLVIFPEALRNLQYALFTLVAAALAPAGAPGATGSLLTPAFIAGTLTEAAAASLLVPFLLGLSYTPTRVATELLAPVETCPVFFRPARDALVAASAAVRARAFRDAALVDDMGSFIISAQGFALVFQAVVLQQRTTLRMVTAHVSSVFAFVLCASAATKLRPTASAPSLDALAARLGLASEQRILRELRDALGAARSEAAMLRAACDALGLLFPGAAAWAVGAFAEGAGCDVVSALETGPDDAARAPLLASLPPDVGAATLSAAAAAAAAAAGAAPGGGTSVAAACNSSGAAGAGAARVLDSRDVRAGIMAFADWAAAAAAGLPSAQAVTAPLTAGPRVVGFVTVHFGLYAARAHNWAPLTEFCDALGGALFVGRAFAINAAPQGPQGVLPPGAGGARHSAGAGGGGGGSHAGGAPRAALGAAGGDDDAPYPATEEDAAALAALDASAASDAPLLRAWSLDAWTLSEEELQRLLLATLHSAGLLRRFRISPTAAAAFIADVASHMNDNPFHSFQHVAVVAHISALLLSHSGLRQRGVLTDVDALVLLLSAMCHDLSHPGLTNAYHVKTRSPLALRYHDTSVLENHHACIGFTLLERAGLLSRLSAVEYGEVRKSMVAAILATDSACPLSLPFFCMRDVA
jgi:hypothetical protein